MRALFDNSGNVLSLESIDFQAGQVLFQELTMAFEQLRKVSKKTLPDSDEARMISTIIRNHCDAEVQMSFDVQGPAVQVPNVNKNHPLVVDIHRNMVSSGNGLSLVNSANGVCRGGVNLKISRLTGIFTKIPHIIEFPMGYVVGSKFTNEELAAIVLHELGHIFTYYEYMSRSLTTNQALAGLAQAYKADLTLPERETILLSVHKAVGLGSSGIKELAKSSNNKVVEAVVLSNIMRQSESELGSNIYDMTSWEYLSDQFATRHGAGRHLVTALDKVMNSVFTPSFRSTPVFMAIEAFKILATVSSLMTLNPFPLIGIMLTTMPGNDTYDKPEARFLRVRNQIVEAQKDNRTTQEDRDRLAADLRSIDAITTHVNDRRDFFTLLWHTLSPRFRNQWKQEQLQKDLEAIAASELFDKANQLKDFLK